MTARVPADGARGETREQFRARLTGAREPALRALAEELAALSLPDAGHGDDELLRRRIWARVATPPPVRSRLGPWLVWSGLALGALGALAVMLPAGQGKLTRGAGEPAGAAPRPAAPPAEPPVTQAPAVLQTGAQERLSARLEERALVELEPESRLVLAPARPPELVRGRVRLAVAPRPPGERFELAVGDTRVRVLGTRFSVALEAPDGLTVEVEEGVVEVVRARQVVRLHAGQRWSGPLALAGEAADARGSPAPRARPLRARPDEADLDARIRAARASGDLHALLELLARQSRGRGLPAQNALYEQGRLLRDQLGQSRDALAAWRAYRNRYPGGALRAEVDLEIIETLLRLGQGERALGEIEAFLARHPGNERSEELVRLRQGLREGRALELR